MGLAFSWVHEHEHAKKNRTWSISRHLDLKLSIKLYIEGAWNNALSDTRLYCISIILKLYSLRYLVNITFHGVATLRSHIFRVLFIMFLLINLYFLMFTCENYTKTIVIGLRLSKYWRPQIFTSPMAR